MADMIQSEYHINLLYKRKHVNCASLNWHANWQMSSSHLKAPLYLRGVLSMVQRTRGVERRRVGWVNRHYSH
jgi:hypothetical protein